ncbi:Serine protease [Phytophthora megakarya]|uniref:Serine protease n=1 Tax=Phytophthora megakarya TaxID=4795 RepID=A0A225V060_9STRA|nr:Serine protease [Phytophthora megakarya]
MTFDLSYHGLKRDESVEPDLDVTNPMGPRKFSVKRKRSEKTWGNTEVQSRGTFDALVLFKPVYGLGIPAIVDKVTSFLVSVT